MIVNTHMHTKYSDGKNSLRQMLKKSITIGYDLIAFSDHVRKSSDWVADYASEILKCKENFRGKIRILTSLEAKVIGFNKKIDISKNDLKKLDFLIASVHSVPLNYSGRKRANVVEGYNGKLIRLESPVSKEELIEFWERATLAIIESKEADVLGHPFRIPFLLNVKIRESTVRKIYEEAKINEKIVEISTKYKNERKYIKILRKIRPMILIGSDSHSLQELAKTYKINKKYSLMFKKEIRSALENVFEKHHSKI
ncbi:MAG: PHP domain-containing protein [Candidatus Woesearchaeota archaeon]